jgi:hypothetical protein
MQRMAPAEIDDNSCTIELHIGRRNTGVSVRPDFEWPGMWRVLQGDRVSDIVNLSRAKDVAIGWARPRGLGQTEVGRWHRRETAPEASYSAFLGEAFNSCRRPQRLKDEPAPEAA